MRLTWRLAGCIAAGAVLFLLSGIWPRLATAGAVYDLAIGALVLADVLLTAPPSSWHVERFLEHRLSLGAPNRVIVAARYTGERVAQPRRVIVRDEPPLSFDVQGEATRSIKTKPGERDNRYGYAVMPPTKGDFEFGDISLQYPGVLGLIGRARTFPAKEPVKVYPNLLETEKFELLARRGLLQQLGIRSLRSRGGGSEFESLREYVPGDEYRKVDWSATARRGKLIARQYEAERSQNIILAIDTGRTMLQPIAKMTKLDYVINAALMVAYVASRSDDKVGLVVFDSETRVFFPPARSRGQLYRILSALYNVHARMTETNYQAAFNEVAARWRRRSLFILFTDLVDPDSSSGLLTALPILERRHRAMCVTVSDPNITQAASISPENEAEAYQKAVATQTQHERRAAISILKRRGIWTVDSPPETLSADTINRYMELKARSAI